MRALALLCAVLALPGCATYDLYRDAALEKERQLQDRIMAASQRFECRRMNVETFQRHYDTPAKVDAWRVRCETTWNQTPTQKVKSE